MIPRYEVRSELRPKGLSGIGEEQIEQHWKLYEGYVKNVNLLNEKLRALADKKEFGPEFAELKRRLGYEYDGMILHERYFGGLKKGGKALSGGGPLFEALKNSFGGFDRWKEEFVGIGKMRGVGWVILYLDPARGALTNHWIGLHDVGHPAGFLPVLVMDVWEHAFMVDYGAQGREKYVAAFLKNVDWSAAERAYAAGTGQAERSEESIDESSAESFPASDAPSWTGGVERKRRPDGPSLGDRPS